MRKILTFWLAALMLVSMMLPTSLAAGDTAAAPAERTEEITAEGEDKGAAKDAETSKNDKASAILSTTATSIPASTAPKTVCYPTAIDVRDEGAEIRKIYDLSPEADPAGIPRADFEHAGFSYTFVDLNDTPDPTDTSDLMGPPTEPVEPSGTVTPTKPIIPTDPEVSTEPTKPENPDSQGQVTGPTEPAPAPTFSFNWAYILVPLLVLALAGTGVGIALFIKHRAENGDDSE